MRLAFVLPMGANRYLQMLAETIGRAGEEMQPFNVECQVDLVTSFNPKALADRLTSLAGDFDGVAFMALEHPLVREAVAALHADDVFVLTLISDLSNSARSAFVGMDNRAAGRTAGLLLGRFIGAPDEAHNKVAMFAGSLSYRGHEERAEQAAVVLLAIDRHLTHPPPVGARADHQLQPQRRGHGRRPVGVRHPGRDCHG